MARRPLTEAQRSARRASNERWRRSKGMVPRAVYEANRPKRADRAAQRPIVAPPWGGSDGAASRPGPGEPEYTMTREELLKLRGYDV